MRVTVKTLHVFTRFFSGLLLVCFSNSMAISTEAPTEHRYNMEIAGNHSSHRSLFSNGSLLATALNEGICGDDLGPRPQKKHAKGQSGIVRTLQIFKGLSMGAPTSISRLEMQDDWILTQFSYQDEGYPLTVDVLATSCEKAEGIIFMLPSSGANFRANYFSPKQENIAHFFRENGYLVVGISPREDAVGEVESYEFMSEWGIENHREDIREIIENLHRVTRRGYEMLAFSYTSLVALDYAATYEDDRLERVVVLDTYSIDPADTEATEKAVGLYNGYEYLIGAGYYMDDSLKNFNDLIGAVVAAPDADSGIPRALMLPPDIAYLYPGNFTNNGLMHFWLINSGMMPGIHTPITGLPHDWPMLLGSMAGYYNPAEDPLDDEFAMTYSTLENIEAFVSNMGASIIPLALQRDCASISANNGVYPIAWEEIDAEVVWVNTEYGYGNQAWGASQIENVTFGIIEDYGNIDPFTSVTAKTDLWEVLLPGGFD